ncbi:MAG: xanthine dehydrogenase small subunit [Burkholderiales bacterium]|nr:xanthine dehydrogenase small subunit [Burkholderiales bacterium]
MSSRPIRFFHRGAVVEVDGAATTRTVLDWLREDARCTGTKEGCNEGDCGACTVVIGELPGAAQAGSPEIVGGLRLTTANACIQFLPTLDGKALFTVEDLKADSLHPVQQAMVECDGSQCGFCTPGFVMSLWATYQHHGARGTRPSRQQLADELSGNLCRCTGYRPILDAGERMFELPAAPLDTAPARAALESLRSEQTFRYAAAGAELVAPKTLEAFAAERLARPEARILAGSTDIGLWVNKMFRELPALLYIGNVDALKRVEARDGVLSIGAAASLEDGWRALVARWPTLADVWLRFAGVPLRHAGTMGGNVANGSPIGDSPPVLMALAATLVLRRGERVRRLPLADYYTGYMQSRLEPGEFVQAIEVPLADPAKVRAYKISKRFDCDISALCAGFAIALDGGAVATARFAFGGMAATVKRATATEAAVLGQPWTEATLLAAQQALATDFAPLSDMRASAAYRLQVAQNLLRRLWLETRAEAPLAPAATSVWARATTAVS